MSHVISSPAGQEGVATAPIAELVNVSKRFGATQALSEVNIQVRPGETHALLGRNGAGKSTAVAALTGLVRPDEGEVRFGGLLAPHDAAAWRDHVACLYQHSTLIASMTVTENLFIDKFSTRGRALLHWPTLRRSAVDLLEQWGIEVNPDAEVADLAFEQRQLVEIARALSQGSKFIIMDEPTAQLDTHQIDRLFESIRRFQTTGISFLYISHFLREVFDLCQRATVMRDGKTILTKDVADLNEDEIIRAMVGTANVAQFAGRASKFQPEAVPSVELRDLSLDGHFAPLSLSIRPGEVLGIAGSVRSGATAVGEVIAGLRRPTSGDLTIGGKPVPQGHVDKAIAAGVGYVPQDRKTQGIVGPLSVAENITMTIPESFGKAGLVSPAKQASAADQFIELYDIKVSSRDDSLDGLSGGNQQKVVVGRAMASSPALLVLDTPTAGVDIASTGTLFDAVDAAAQQGLAVMVISNTISELRLCDKVHVMFNGELTSEFEAGWDEPLMVAAIEGVSA